jgi:HK97 gp10 family phage protein
MDQFQIQGLDEVLKKMRAMGPGLAAKGARTAMRKAANVVRDAAKANAAALDRPETPNRIADNIAVQFSAKTLKTTGDVMMRVGVRGGAKQYANTRENRGKGRVGLLLAVPGVRHFEDARASVHAPRAAGERRPRHGRRGR